MKAIQKIGLEAEVFVINKDGIVIASELGLPCDDFCLLGEIRGAPGETSTEVYLNFMKAYLEFSDAAEKKGCVISTTGSMWISHELYAKVMKMMGSKEWPECANIYGTDISAITDVRTEDGIVKEHAISCGLHIHFSDEIVEEIKYKTTPQPFVYDQVDLPISFGDGKISSTIKLYTRRNVDVDNGERTIKATVSRITRPVIRYVVEKMDTLLPKYAPLIRTKYRHPGFFEIKPWGFEYRSLGFSEAVLRDLREIAAFAFSLLKEL